MTRKTIAAVAATALLVPALLAAAGQAVHEPEVQGLAQRVIERLDLTPEQVKEVRGILASHKDELTFELKRIQATRGTMFDAIHADTFSEAEIRNAAGAVGRAEADLAVTRGKVAQEVRKVLTPEQQAKAKEVLADARAVVQGMISRMVERLNSDPLAGV
ncbi:MAG TPA: Spy/CpxP family protein refolding chaperone [Thermoanaerobaculia bacterium]|nr:Spy/CpxP family protein refolding chaperone [Thermoanaerobaculia bacterium]